MTISTLPTVSPEFRPLPWKKTLPGDHLLQIKLREKLRNWWGHPAREGIQTEYMGRFWGMAPPDATQKERTTV